MTDRPETRSQHDQQDWLAVAEFEDEEEAGRAATMLQEAGVPSMIDQRTMNARFAVLVSALQRDAARRVIDELPDSGVVDDTA